MPSNERPRILCVDDEPNVLDGLARTLRSHYVVETASEGKVALDLLRTAAPFAIVMSDQRMPQMTGVQLLARPAACAHFAYEATFTFDGITTSRLSCFRKTAMIERGGNGSHGSIHRKMGVNKLSSRI